MQHARLRSHMLGDGGEEGDDVMLHLPLDGVDAGDVEAAALAHGLRRFFRNEPERGHAFGGIGLDV